MAAIDEIALLAAAAGSAKDLFNEVSKRAARTANPDDVTILAVRRTAQQETARAGEVSAHDSPALTTAG